MTRSFAAPGMPELPGEDTRCEGHANTHTMRIAESGRTDRSAPLTPLKKSREKISHGLRIGTQASPLRTTAPYGCSPPTGWVTALAGLLACGSLHTVRPSRFPSDHLWTIGSPLTVAGAATASTRKSVSVFPLASPARTGEPARWGNYPAYRENDQIARNVAVTVHSRRSCVAATNNCRQLAILGPASGRARDAGRPAASQPVTHTASCAERDCQYKTRLGRHRGIQAGCWQPALGLVLRLLHRLR